jgi:cytochrome c6
MLDAIKIATPSDKLSTQRRSMMRIANLSLFVVVAALAVVFMLPSSATAQNAAATYKAKCAGCHGADGKGNTGPGKALGAHDFGSDEVAKMSDADLAKTVTDGKNKMPAYGKSLKETEITDLIAYIRQLVKQK